MSVTSLFATPFYRAELAQPALLADLAASCTALAQDDAAGRRWCRDNGYQGYTSYASLDDLPLRDPAIAALVKALSRHVAAFAAAAHLALPRKPRLDSLWVNVLKPGAGHSGHIHPHSWISGTFYVAVPEGAGALKLEDPRLPMLMAAPARTADAPAAARPFVYMQPQPGTLFLWESWLRHEVVAGSRGQKGERISVSFNYA